MRKVYALVDCNNFYVSCERVFNPLLKNKPVVVLSNNDGCIVARSNEVKKLDIGFGLPVFKFKNLLRRHKVKMFSSNYTLYGDMSRRVMNILEDFTPELEIYSIDEAFMILEGFENFNLSEYGRKIKKRVEQCTGIPISIGFGATKTLSKIANKLAKKRYGGVLDISRDADISPWLEEFPIEDVWGIGRSFSQFLIKKGILNARDFRDVSESWIRKYMHVNGSRTLMELRGYPCIEENEAPVPNKTIICSRSFGRDTEEYDDLCESVSLYITKAAERLRKEGLVAGNLQVFLLTNRFRDMPQYNGSLSTELSVPTASTPELIMEGTGLLKKIFRKGYRYKKAGIMLSELSDEDECQLNLFSEEYYDDKKKRLMKTIDSLNKKMGQDTLKFASSGINRKWHMRREFTSPHYTTRWSDIPTALA